MAEATLYEFRMPSLGADMEAGTLTRWLVAPGDTVRRGDLVAVVETEKSDIDVEIFTGGTVVELLVAPGQTVPVGTPLARLSTTEPLPAAEVAAALPVSSTPSLAAAAPMVVPRSGGAVAASPAARRRASELGVELAAVSGTGPGGAVRLEDVELATRGPAPARRGMRRVLAATMERSNREIPHYYLGATFDLSPALTWLEAANRERPVAKRLLPAALLLKAVARAARVVPELNGFWLEGGFQPAEAVNLGVAISRRRAETVVPVLHGVDGKSLDELMAALADLVERARGGSLKSSELAGATLTVTQLGELGAESVYGVIYPPQVALVGFGRIVERPWAEAGVVSVRPLIQATLAADHRASDGFAGSRFLAAIGAALTQPEV